MALSAVLAPLQGLLNYFQTERHHLTQERNEQKDQALADLNAALVATTQYLQRGRTSSEVETELSERWSRAARSCRHFDNNLAQQLQLKSFWWGDHASVQQSELIQLRTIQQAILHLIQID
jgi:hypothetical protein